MLERESIYDKLHRSMSRFNRTRVNEQTIIDHHKPSVSQQPKQRLDSITTSKFTVIHSIYLLHNEDRSGQNYIKPSLSYNLFIYLSRLEERKMPWFLIYNTDIMNIPRICGCIDIICLLALIQILSLLYVNTTDVFSMVT